jgi:hypothetical protein
VTSEEPHYEVRWCVEGHRFSFGTEAQARAFALPGQRVYPERRISDTATTGEFKIELDL